MLWWEWVGAKWLESYLCASLYRISRQTGCVGGICLGHRAPVLREKEEIHGWHWHTGPIQTLSPHTHVIVRHGCHSVTRRAVPLRVLWDTTHTTSPSAYLPFSTAPPCPQARESCLLASRSCSRPSKAGYMRPFLSFSTLVTEPSALCRSPHHHQT